MTREPDSLFEEADLMDDAPLPHLRPGDRRGNYVLGHDGVWRFEPLEEQKSITPGLQKTLLVIVAAELLVLLLFVIFKSFA